MQLSEQRKQEFIERVEKRRKQGNTIEQLELSLAHSKKMTKLIEEALFAARYGVLEEGQK